MACKSNFDIVSIIKELLQNNKSLNTYSVMQNPKILALFQNMDEETASALQLSVMEILSKECENKNIKQNNDDIMSQIRAIDNVYEKKGMDPILAAQILAIDQKCLEEKKQKDKQKKTDMHSKDDEEDDDDQEEYEMYDDIKNSSAISCTLCMELYRDLYTEGKSKIFVTMCCYKDMCKSCYDKIKREIKVIYGDPPKEIMCKECPHCRKPLQEAVEELRNVRIKNIYDTDVKCKRCKETYKYENYGEHYLACKAGTRTCKNEGCNKKFIMGDEEKKHLEVCEFKDKTCEVCNVPIKMIKFKDHNKECPSVIIACETIGCDFKAQRKDYKDHNDVCPHKVLECKGVIFGCKIKEKNIGEHENKCDLYPVLCECKTKIIRRNIESHKEECPKFLIVCPNECGASITRDSIKTHREECPNELIDCINNDKLAHTSKCKKMLRKMLISHLENNCLQTMIHCDNNCLHNNGDKFMFKRVEKEDHYSKCPNMKIMCNDCKKEYFRKHEEKHYDECDESYCICPYDKNCVYQIKKKLMNMHIEDHKADRLPKEYKEQSYEIGMLCDAKDNRGSWYSARIKAKSNLGCLVIFMGWSSLDSEFVDFSSIAPYRSITKYGLYVGREIIVRYPDDMYYKATVIRNSSYNWIVRRDIDKKEHVFAATDNCYEPLHNNKLLITGNIYDVVHKDQWVAAKLINMDIQHVYFKYIEVSKDLQSTAPNICINYTDAMNKIFVKNFYGSGGSKQSRKFIR
jgi:hypothetical protein